MWIVESFLLYFVNVTRFLSGQIKNVMVSVYGNYIDQFVQTKEDVKACAEKTRARLQSLEPAGQSQVSILYKHRWNNKPDISPDVYSMPNMVKRSYCTRASE